MPRTNRVTPGGMVFHVLNRGVGRMRLFDSDADYLAFENILDETLVVQQVQTEGELEALRRCVNRGQPFGPESWVERCVRKLGLESTIRPRGRPRTRD